MAIVFDGPVLPDDLTVFIREVPQPDQLVLNQILPDRLVNFNRVDVGQLTKTGRTARFRAYDSRPHVSKRDVAVLQTVHLPPLSDSLPMGELERLQLEFARTQGTNQDAFVEAIYDDATTLTNNALRRMEQARGDVLTDGKFTLTGEGGLTLEADFGVPSGNIVAPAGALWTDHSTSVPITDELTWVRAYNVLNGYRPGGQIISYDRLMDLLQNEQLRALVSSLVGTPQLLSRDQLDAIFVNFGLPPIVMVYDTQVDVDGTSTRVIPDDKVIFVPPNPAQNLGYTAWGVSATALELVRAEESALTFQQAMGIVGIVDKEGSVPFHQRVVVDGVGMPVLENSNALMVADVA